MATNTALNSEIICDLEGQPLDRGSAALLKAVDKLLTVGAYYSAEHDQYRVVSEKSCAQIVEAIRPEPAVAIEITASGMMIRSQLIDPHHRNVRLLHDLLVPLNIARLEISADLTGADLRQAISALQEHKLNLGNTEGFQEIMIENLPATVNTASRSVTRSGEALSLGDLFGSGASDGNAPDFDETASASELLAREFMEIVARILENLEKEEQDADRVKGEAHPDSSPENIKALREALRRLVEVNPDPGDLARLIEHAKRALDLSHDPGSVDLVFSLLKKEADRGGEWKYKAHKKSGAEVDFKMSLEQLRLAADDLQTRGAAPEAPGPSSFSNYLAICFHLLSADPAETLEIALVSNLNQALLDDRMTRQDLNLCSAAVATLTLTADRNTVDRILPAFCGPLRVAQPQALAKFWARLWETLDADRRAVVWPHLVSDLILGLEGLSPETVKIMWRAAGELDPKDALLQVSRLECTPALREKSNCAELMRLPLAPMYPVHLALMKSSLSPVHGPRIHHHLRHDPPNGLSEVLMKAIGKYDPSNNGFYLSLIKQVGSATLTLDLRKWSVRLISNSLGGLNRNSRNLKWVPRAIGWAGKLDIQSARPLLIRVLDERRFFFLKAWPAECREKAQEILDNVKEGE